MSVCAGVGAEGGEAEGHPKGRLSILGHAPSLVLQPQRVLAHQQHLQGVGSQLLQSQIQLEVALEE